MKIKVICGGICRVLEYSETVSLLQAAAESGLAVYAPCGGDGRCGRCLVTARGDISLPDAFEQERLGEYELGRGVRLACRARALGDCDIIIGETYTERVSHKGVGAGSRIGIAVDIGTTTVAASLTDMVTGRRIAEASAHNPQAVWGADVISRISAVTDGKVDVETMSRLVHECAEELCKTAGAEAELAASDNAESGTVLAYLPQTASNTVVVGNTVMMSLWEKIDPTPIGRAPFIAPTLFGSKSGGVFLPRCVSGYFGADAVSSVLAAFEDCGTERDFIVADIGTNGEVAAWSGGRLYTCAAPAGPALEGGGISCGMPAVDGAIDSAEVHAGRINCHVIGEGTARGICGSGLIDAVACLLSLGVIDKDGYMAEPYELADGVAVTPADVRAMQLAKAAIRAAIETVMQQTRTPALYLSGSFGSCISLRSCVRIGLVPSSLAENTRVLGNGALRGAELMLISDKMRELETRIASDACYTELSGSDEFERRFVGALCF